MSHVDLHRTCIPGVSRALSQNDLENRIAENPYDVVANSFSYRSTMRVLPEDMNADSFWPLLSLQLSLEHASGAFQQYAQPVD